MKKTKKILGIVLAIIALTLVMSISIFATEANAADGNVAKVGDTEYATIDEAIANWTNGTTLTLLADVTLSDVVTLKSTEHHILDLGTYTMTAASGKHAIEITCEGRTSASYAITVNADATNPGGITATGKSCIYYSKTGTAKDRPIIRIYNGVFNGSYSINSKSNGNTNCPQIWIYGGTFNGNVNLTKNMLRVFGGTFNGWINCTGDSSAYREISGGRFKSWQFMTADADNKFWVGTSKANYDVGVYVDADGYLVVGGDVITEVSAEYPAVATNYSKWSGYLKYSSAATYGLFYKDPAMAIEKHGEENVTVYVKPAVTIPENVEGDAGVVEEIKNNTALKNYIPENLPEGAELEIKLVSVGDTIVFDIAPMANGTKVEPTEAIIFRLPIPASVTENAAKVYHEGVLIGTYAVQGEGDAKYIEVSSADFSEYAVEPVEAVAKIGNTCYTTFAEALTAASALTGDVTVEIYDKVTLNSAISGSFDSITFVGKDTDAEIYLDVQGYITATGKKVAFEDLTLSKSAGGFITNAGFMNVAFGVYDVVSVDYTNCVFANGAYASSGDVTFTKCTFYRSHDKYGLWAYGDTNAVVDNCVFNDYRGIKMYAEGAAKTTDLTVKNTDFSAVNDKPAIVLTYGESVTLEGNTYSSTGTFELDLDGAPNGVAVTSDVAPTCKNDNGACGVLVDGKIYTTVAQAAAVAESGSTVTLLHDSTETVELAEGVTLDKNGYTADGVTVAVPAPPVASVNGVKYETLQAAINAAQNGETVTLIGNATGDVTVAEGQNITIDLNGNDIVGTTNGIINNGTLIINDTVGTGNVYTTDVSAQGRAAIVNNGTITINGGWFGDSNNDTTDRNAINRGNAIKNYGVATINGGYFTNVSNQYIDTNAYAYAINTLAGGTTTINNATVYGDINGLIYSDGKTIVNDGSFTLGRPNEENNLWYLAYGDVEIKGGTWTRAFAVPSWNTGDPTFNGEVAVSGGSFNVDVKEEYLADGYKTVDNGDGTFGIEKNVVAIVNGVEYSTLAEAFAAVTDDSQTVVILGDITENLTGIYLRGNIVAAEGTNVTITLTNTDWVYCPYTFVIGENVTLNIPNGGLFYYAGGTVIKGTVVANAYYQSYAGTKLTVEGALTITGETFIVRYMDGDETAGIYVDGGTLTAPVIYFYQGTISAKNGATINTSVYWQTNDTDGQGSANLLLDNSVLNISGTENVSATSGTATVTLKSGAQINAVGSIEFNAGSSIEVINSTFVAKNLTTNKNFFISGNSTVQVENLSGRAIVLDGTVLTDSYIKSTTNGTTRILGDVTFNGDFGAAYIMTAGSQAETSGYEGAITINGTLNASYGVEFNGNLTLNGGTIELSGGNANGGIWGMVFQNGEFVINTDLTVIGNTGTYAPIYFTNANATVNSTITQRNSGGEPLYVGEETVLTLGKDAVIDTLSLHGTGKMVIDATGMAAGEYANVVCGASNFKGTIEVINGEFVASVVDGKIVLAKAVAAVDGVYYSSIQAAVDAANTGDTITILANVADEAVTVNKNVTITSDADNKVTLNNVSISGTSGVELTVSNLKFTGNSWINSNGAAKLVVSGVDADVEPVNTSATNSRSAFIALGSSEHAPLELVIENCTIIADGDRVNAVLGWAPITSATITGNTFGSEDFYYNNCDAIKFMGIADGAVFTIENNTIYGNYNGIVFGQNTTRDNSYTVYVDGNAFVGGADHIWIEVSGATTTYGKFNVTSNNTVNGNTFTASDIKTNVANFAYYAGVDVVLNENGEIIGGSFAKINEELIADGYELVDGVVSKVQVAEVNGVKYATLEEALAALTEGGTLTLLADGTISADVTLPANVTIVGNGKSITGATVWAGGNVTFEGHVKLQTFNAGYNKPTITIGEGACLEMTTGRMVIGHGATFNITGTISDAKNANVADLTPSLIIPGASFTGAGVNFNVTNAYIKATAYCSSKNSSANGTFNINVTNSVWEQTGSFVFSEPASGKDPTFNFTLKDSVMNSTSHLVFGVTKGEIVFDNSNVNVGTSRQLENRSTLTIKNGSVVYAAHATSSNAKNPGTTIVENATYIATGDFSGSDVGTGTIIVKNGANVTFGKITKANIVVDATGMEAGDVINLTANLSGLTGTLSVVNNDKLEAEIVDGKIVLVAKPVAQIGDVKYATLEEAIAAAQAGETVELLSNVTVTGSGAYIMLNKAITIDGNGYTVSMKQDTAFAYALLYLYAIDGTVTIKDTTFDGITSGAVIWAHDADVVIDNCVFQNGNHTQVQGLVRTTCANLTLTNSEFINNNCNFVITFNYDAAESDKMVVENCTFSGNTVNDTAVIYYVDGASSTITDSSFVGNTVNSASHGAIVYYSNGQNGTVTGNEFIDNTITAAGARATVLALEAGTTATENAFVNNTCTSTASGTTYVGTVLNKADADSAGVVISGNYWNGGAPDVIVSKGAPTTIENYYTTYENGVLGGLTALVAEVNGVKYATLEEALKALTDGATLTLLENVTIDGAWDCRYNGAKITVPVTIDGNGKTITLTGAVDDKNWNTVFRFEANATVKNLTIDASAATSIQRAISAKYSITVDGCTFIGNGTSAKRAIIFGEGAGADLANVTATITNCEFINWSYGISDNQSGKDAASVTITGNTFTNASVLVSASEKVTFNNNELTNGYVNITSYTNANEVVVEATNNSLDATLDNEISVKPENVTADDGFATPIAKNNTTGKYYFDLAKAISRANEGETITLVADVVLTDTLTIAADKVVALDLNGKTISQTKAQTAGYQMILNDGNLTINDSVGGGKISYTDSGNGGEYISDTIYNRGVLVINGGTIENLSSATVAANGYPHAVDTYSGIRDTSVTINGGTIYCASYSAIRMFCVSATYKADLVINDGTIKGSVDMQNGTTAAANGTLTINGGTFEKTASRANVRFANWNGNATTYGITAAITGGTFDAGINTAYVPAAANWNSKIVSGGTFGVAVDESLCAEGFACVENADGTYGIKKTYAEVSTWEELANAVSDKYITDIKLTADITAEGRLVVDRDLNIDLNGKTLSLTQVNNRVWKAATLTINGNGKIDVSAVDGGNVFYVGSAETGAGTNGNLVLENIEVYGDNYNTGTNAAVFMLYGPASSTLNITNCKLNLSNNRGNGSVFYDTGTNNQCKINIVDSELNFNGTVRGSVCGNITIDNSTVVIKNCDNGFNEATLTIKNGSDVTITDNTGRGITVNRNGYGIVIEDSTVYLANNGEGDIRYKASANITITNSDLNLCNVVVDDGKVATINGLAVENGATVQSVDGVVTINNPVAQIGDVKYATLQEAIAAAQNDDTITLLADVELDASITVTKSITIDGNGNKITQSANCDNTHALLYFDANDVLDITIKNVTFDGIKGGAAIRTLGANMTIDNCVFQNCEHTQVQGLVRLTQGKASITNTKFLNNNCSMAVSFNYDTAGLEGDTFVIDNCVFEGNTADTTAIVYYVKGDGCTITNSEFVGNTVNCDSNGATIYLGFTENNVVTNNLFENNTVTDSSTSIRVAGAIFFGYEAEISGNVFINNTATNANGDVLGQVCTSTYYNCEIDLSGNYWGGEAPVYGKDYTVLHQTGEAEFALDSYNSTYTTDENGNVVVGGEVSLNYVAQVGKFKYESLQDAINAANGATVTLLSDINIDATVKVERGNTVVLDLNGYTIDGREKVNIAIMSYGNFTLKDSVGTGFVKAGKYAADGKNSGNTINICEGTFVFESGNIYSINNGILVDENVTNVTINGGTVTAEKDTKNSAAIVVQPYDDGRTEITINGGTFEGYFGILISKSTKLTITNGDITGVYGTALQGNGSYDSTEIKISGGTLTGSEAAIYHPQGGTLDITGGTFVGDTAIAIKGGKVTISGGTFEAVGAKVDYAPESSGFASTGDALYVEHYDNSTNSSHYGTPVVTVTGGTFVSANGKAVASYANSNNSVEALAQFVSGGTFNTPVAEELCAAGFVPVDNGNGTYGVVKDPYAISSLEELKAFRDKVNAGDKCYGETWYLTTDIDLLGEEWTPIGTNDHPFQGTFDGKGYTISNLVITGRNDKVGLFGRVNNTGGELKNLTIHNAMVSGDSEIGALVATPGTFKISNIKLTGHVEIDGYQFVGAVGGKNANADWNNVIVDVDDTSFVKATSTVDGTKYTTHVGGVIGMNGNIAHSLTNISSNIKVIGDVKYIGGLFGTVNGNNTIENVTFTGTVEAAEGATHVGAIAGVWVNTYGQEVVINNADYTNATVKVGNTAVDQLVGGVYYPAQDTADTSGKLIVDGEQKWPLAAKIGSNYYATLAEAIAAAQAGETVTVLNDVTLDATITIENAITLDLGGKTVTGADGAIVFNVKADTKVVNGTIIGSKSGTTSGAIDIYANLTMEGVTVETSKILALRFKAGDCTATLTNCNVTGAFKGYGGSVWNIVSGTYKASSTSVSEQINGTAQVSGGTFYYEIAADKFAPGYAAKDNGDGSYTVEYAPVGFIDANNNGTLDDGEVIFGNLEFVFNNYKNGDVYVVLTDNAVINNQVDTTVNAKYYINTNVAEGVTVDFKYADNWNYVQNMYIGENVTVNAKYLLLWNDVVIDGTVNTTYLYMLGATVTVGESGTVNANTGDATVQVKDNTTFTVNGKVNTAILNVWVNNAELVVNGENAEVNASWIDIWDGAPTVTVENGATLAVESIKASRGGEITVTDATLDADNVILGHNNESAGKLTVNNGTVTGPIELTTVDSTIAGAEGMNVFTNIADHKVVYENGIYSVVAKVYVAQVGDTKYESLQDALAAANAGETITLLAPIVVNAGETLEIDLAGKILAYTSDVVGEDMITNYGTLTINDSVGGGKIVYTNTDVTGSNVTVSTITNAPGGLLTVNGGTIENARPADIAWGYSIYAFAIDNVTNGTLGTAKTVINDGVIKSTYRSIRLFANSTSDRNTVNINGGEMIGQVWLQAANANANKVSLVINDGKFAPVGNDGSSVYVTTLNNTKPTFRVLGGYFATKIGTDNATLAANYGIVGGTFTAAAMQNTPAGLVRSGYEFVANEDGTYGVDTIKVASVIDANGNVTKYANIREAVNALTDGATLTLLADTTYQLSFEGVSATLDLNGYSITVSGAAIFVEDGASLTVVGDGNITSTNDTFTVENGTLIINGGTIESTGGDTISASYATVEINGGKLVAAENAISMIANSASAPNSLTITGGEIVAGDYAIATNGTYDDSTITISGGKLGDVYHSAEGTLAISGGKVGNVEAKSGDVAISGTATVESVAVEYLGEGYGNVNVAVTGGTIENGIELVSVGSTLSGAEGMNVFTNIADHKVVYENGIYSVVAKVYVAQVGDAKYESLQDAIDAANGGTVTLLSDVNITSYVKVTSGNTVTLDLNGYTIDGIGNTRIAIMSYGNLTIMDSSDAKTGTIKAGKDYDNGNKGGNTINVCAGTFTLMSGNIYSQNNGILIDEQAAVVYIYGGTITAEPTTNNSAVFYISSTSATELNILGGEMVGYNGILLWNNTVINMSAGSIDAQGRLGIQGNGSKDNTEINISGTASVNGLEAGIYHPQGGKLNISENATISGGSGIIVKGGYVTISGGTIIANGEAVAYEPVSSGFVSTGDALYVEVYDNSTNSENYGKPTVVVTGGNFISANGEAVASYANPNNNVEALNSFISGGTFSSDVTELCANGLVAKENTDGTYGIVDQPIPDIATYVTIRTDSGTYLHLNIDNAYAKESLVIKLYDANGNLLSETALANAYYLKWFGRLTGNIEITRESSAWETVWYGQSPDAAVVPAYAEVWADGVLCDTASTNFTAEAWAATDGVKTYVAQVGDVKYATLQDAIDAAANGGTVVLLDNIALNTTITVDGTVTLDLAGHTITGTDNNTSGNFYLINVNKGTFTLEDSVGEGAITLTATTERNWNASSVVIANTQGTVTVNGGTITHLGGTSMAYALDNLTNGNNTVATMVVNGGTIDSTYFAIRQFANNGTNNLTINGGDIGYVWMQSPNPNANVASTTVNGGTVDGICVTGNNAVYTLKALATSVGEVYGTAPVDQKFAEVDGYYVLVDCVYVAEVNGVKYESLQDAIDAAGNGDTVELLANVELTSSLTINKAITINGNGYSITGKTVNVSSNVTLAGVLNFSGLYQYASGNITVAEGADIDVQGSLATYGGVLTVSANAEISAVSVYLNGGVIDIYGKFTATPGYDGGLILNSTNTKAEDGVINVYESGELVAGYVNSGRTSGFSTVNVYGTANFGSFFRAGDTDKYTIYLNVIGGDATFKNVDVGATSKFSLDIAGKINVTGAMTGSGSIVIDAAEFDGTSIQVVECASIADTISVEIANNNEAIAEITETGVTVKINPVAMIGDKVYGSLQEAIDAAGEGDIITLLADITVASDLNNAAKGLYNIAADDKITIDLGGYTIDVTDNSTGNFIVFYNYGELTIKNGTVELTATNNRGWNAQSTAILNRGGKLTIESGSYVHNGGTDMAITVDNSGNSFGDAYLYVNGGEITSTYVGIRLRMADPTLNGNPGNGLVYTEITGGEIYGGSRGIWGQITNASSLELGSLAITGGTISGGNNSLRITTDGHDNIDVTISGNAVINGAILGEGSDFAITGGTFDAPVAAELCADGYIPCDNGDGTYGVKLGKFVATVNGVGYETVTEAIKAANDCDTVQLLAGTITETINPWGTDSTHASEKSITIVGADNFGTTLTGGLVLGYDDSGCRAHTITIKGIVFEGMGVVVAGQQTVVIEGNKFIDITAAPVSASSANANAISVIGKNVNATVTDNIIDGVAVAGINLRDILNATVSGNTITNTQHNSITITTTSGSEGTVNVNGNNLSDWGLGGEGRAVRISGGNIVYVYNNVMTYEGDAPEEFVKVTNVITGMNLSQNYWNGKSPLEEGVFEANVAPSNYYADAEFTTLIKIVQWEQISMTYGSDLKMNFYLQSGSLMEGVNYYAKVTKTHACGDGAETFYIPMTDDTWLTNGAFKQIIVDNIAAKEMNCTISMQIFMGETENGVAISTEEGTSVVDYALYLIREYEDSTDALKTFAVDMLNYGAAAQKYFHHYENEHLANADLTEAEQALATPSVNENTVETTVYGNANYAEKVTLELETSIYLNFYFNNLTNLATDYDTSKITALAYYVDHYGNQVIVEIANEDIEFSESGHQAKVSVTTLAPADASAPVMCVLYYDKVATTAIESSIATYCEWGMTATDVEEPERFNALCEKIMKYSQSAYTYFQSKTISDNT